VLPLLILARAYLRCADWWPGTSQDKRGFGKGGGGGAPTKYPFETIGKLVREFFVANSEVAKGNAHKTMGSAVGSANQRFAVGTGEQETVERVKRGADHKAIKGAEWQECEGNGYAGKEEVH